MPSPRKLTDEQVADMRRLWDIHGMSVTKLGKRFGIHRSAAFKIVKRKVYQ